MTKAAFQAVHHHLVGIGGSGMAALAEMLLDQGHRVTGSDASMNAVVKRLQARGAEITRGHLGSVLAGASCVIYSTAIAVDNPELVMAKDLNIPLVSRGQFLADLLAQKKGIAVAGTHGKTTTTSLLASVLLTAGVEPSYAIGGALHATGCNGHWGKGDHMVVESDESDASFMLLWPKIAIVTNIDEDHMHTYDYDRARLEQCFLEFLQHIPDDGMAVLCWEDAGVRALSRSLTMPVKTYGFSSLADVWAENIAYDGMRCHFDVRGLADQPLRLTLALPGAHNVLNALAALVVADALGVPVASAKEALQHFSGVQRRSQYHGCLPCAGGEYHLIEDYGHHPKEIDVTVDAIRHAWPKQRLVLVFQPHRYTRTQALCADFCEALATADVLFLCDIYPAGEAPIVGFDCQVLIQHLKSHHDLPVVFVPVLSLLTKQLQEVIRPGDVVVLQGAGTIHMSVQALLASGGRCVEEGI